MGKEQTKKCSKCGVVKDFGDFSKRKTRKLRYWCKECCRVAGKEYRNRPDVKIRARAYRRQYEKNNKDKIKIRKHQYHLRNKKRIAKVKRIYRAKNVDKIKRRNAIYRLENKEKITKYHKEYSSSRIVKSRENLLRKKRIQTDINFRIRKNVGSMVHGRLKRRILNKKGKATFDILPYTVEDLKNHLEKLFEPWMNWDNWGLGVGTWNIDHIVPDASFNYTSVEDVEFQKCWALDNLRPFDAIENIKKGNKLNYERIE